LQEIDSLDHPDMLRDLMKAEQRFLEIAH